MTIRPRVALAAASLLLVAAGSARADTSYLLGIQGTDQRYYPVCRLPGQAPPCDTTVLLPWTGTLDIVIDSSADGVYTGTDVLAFDFRTSAGSLSLQPLDDFGSVTIVGGQVSAVSFSWPPFDPNGDFAVDGLHVTFDREFDSPHEGSDVASGVLAPVPEPAGASLMALALAGTWLAMRSKRSSSGSAQPTVAA